MRGQVSSSDGATKEGLTMKKSLKKLITLDIRLRGIIDKNTDYLNEHKELSDRLSDAEFQLYTAIQFIQDF
jgi:hypothetical protein